MRGYDEYYARYWLQTIRYVSRSKFLRDKSPAELIIDRRQFAHGEPVPIRVRFRQEGIAPSAAEPVTVMLERESAASRPLVLAPEGDAGTVFTGSANDLQPGSYRVWLAAPSLQTPPAPRTLEVAPPAQEQTMRPLNAQELQQAVKISQGRYYTLATADRLPGDLPRGQRIRIESLPPEPAWNSPLAALLFVGLLTAEWVLRKRAGLL
jgi:hypothetical protein